MVSVNLIPSNVRLAQACRYRVKRWGVSIVAGLAVLAVPASIDWLQHARAAELHQERDRLNLEVAAVKTELRTLTAQVQEASVQLERANALRSKRAWSAMLATIEHCMPRGCWVTSIATDPAVPGPAASSAPPARRADSTSERSQPVVIDAPRRLKITGYAADIAEPQEFIASLKDTGAFSRVLLGRTDREPVLDGTYFRFELSCEW
jgi:Tfp pilus assembly protein PilN